MWKTVDSPFGPDLIIAEVDGRIVNVDLNNFLNIKIGNSILFSEYAAYTTTHPDFRGKGIHDAKLAYKNKIKEKRNIQFTYLQSTNPIVINRQEKQGRLPFPHRISHMIRVKNLNIYFKNKKIEKNATLLKNGYTMLKILNKTYKILKPLPMSKQDFEIKTINSFEKRYDHFWDKIKENHAFILEKNQKYLNWRYCDSRGGQYITKAAVGSEGILGFVVYLLMGEDEYFEGYLSELLTLPNRLDVASALLKSSCDYFDDHDVNSINYSVVDGHPYQALSESEGFIDTNGVRLINSSLLSGSKLFGNFRKCMDDYEILRTSPPLKVHFNYGDTL